MTMQNIVTGHSARPAAHRAHPATSPVPSAVPAPTPGATAHASPSPTTLSPTPSPTASAGQRSFSAPGTPVLPSLGAG